MDQHLVPASSHPLQVDFYLDGWLIQPSQFKIVGQEGEVLSVEPKVMQVLLCLVEHQGKVVTRDRLMEMVWPDVIIVDDTLTRCISQLRKIFGETPAQPRVIETIRKRGYRLLVPIRMPGALTPVSQPAPMVVSSHLPRKTRRSYRMRWTAAVGVLCLMVYGMGWYSGNQQLRPTIIQAGKASNGFAFLDSTETLSFPDGGPNSFVLKGDPVSLEEATVLVGKAGEDTVFVWQKDEASVLN